jgi:Ni,Fe-hydrogenase I large subunit
VVPTTWNASPRDPKGQIGAYEAALMGTQMAIPDQPLEILRTLHSFDPAWHVQPTYSATTAANLSPSRFAKR